MPFKSQLLFPPVWRMGAVNSKEGHLISHLSLQVSSGSRLLHTSDSTDLKLIYLWPLFLAKHYLIVFGYLNQVMSDKGHQISTCRPLHLFFNYRGYFVLLYCWSISVLFFFLPSSSSDFFLMFCLLFLTSPFAVYFFFLVFCLLLCSSFTVFLSFVFCLLFASSSS